MPNFDCRFLSLWFQQESEVTSFPVWEETRWQHFRILWHTDIAIYLYKMLPLETQVGAEGDSGLRLHLTSGKVGAVWLCHHFMTPHPGCPMSWQKQTCPVNSTPVWWEFCHHFWISVNPACLSSCQDLRGKGACAVLIQGRKVPGLPPEMQGIAGPWWQNGPGFVVL